MSSAVYAIFLLTFVVSVKGEVSDECIECFSQVRDSRTDSCVTSHGTDYIGCGKYDITYSMWQHLRTANPDEYETCALDDECALGFTREFTKEMVKECDHLYDVPSGKEYNCFQYGTIWYYIPGSNCTRARGEIPFPDLLMDACPAADRIRPPSSFNPTICESRLTVYGECQMNSLPCYDGNGGYVDGLCRRPNRGHKWIKREYYYSCCVNGTGYAPPIDKPSKY